MKKLFFAISFMLGWNTAYVQNVNYVRSWEVTRPGIKNIDDVVQLAPGDANMTTQYIDGMGRTFQTVQRMVSPAQKDYVQPSEFDILGREAKSLMPYVANSSNGSFQPNGLVDQQVFWSTLFPGESRFFGERIYDETAMGRIIGGQRPGNNREAAGRRDQYTYSFGGQKHIWTIGPSASDLPVTSALYPDATLGIQGTRNEQFVNRFTYIDFKGNKILEQIQKTASSNSDWIDFHSTYYVYDDFDRLRYIITPKAVEWLAGHNWALTQAIADELCYKYIYDDRGRLISQKQPGAEQCEFVYDQRGRVVFVRDGMDRSNKRWLATLYDELDRIQLKGYIISTFYDTREVLQNYIDQQEMTPTVINGQVGNNAGIIKNLVVNTREVGRELYSAGNEVRFESEFESEANAEFTADISRPSLQSGNIQVPVMGNPIPVTNVSLVVLSRFYYDNYEFEFAQAFNNNYQFPSINNPNLLEIRKSDRILDQVTGMQSRVIEGSDEQAAASFLPRTYHYDDHGNLIQVIAGNYLGGEDISTNLYEYSGTLLANSLIQNVPNTSIQNFRTGTLFEYDANGRQLAVSKSFSDQPYRKLRTFSYDELGNVNKETIAPDYNNGQGIEALAYDYSLQGWLKGTNASYVNSTSRSEQWLHYFGEVLGYENQDGSFNKPRYDGKLTGAIWKSQGDNIPRKYNYDYTYAGLLSQAAFTQNENLSSGGWDNAKMDASIPFVNYDANGNISTLQQRGLLPGHTAPVVIDDLSYQYKNDGLSNRLISVSDGATTGNLNGVTGDFKNGEAAPSEQYVYNAGGALINDFNKNIRDEETSGVLYNVLNKPRKVTVAGKYELNYVYDSEGTLLAKRIVEKELSSVKERWQYYTNGMMLFDQAPQYITFEGGRLRISQVKSSEINTTPSLQIGGNNGLLIDGRPAFHDYFIMDRQGSTRAVLTEEEHIEGHLATMEISDPVRQTYEESMFGKVNNNGQATGDNELIAARVDMPSLWESHYNDPLNKKAARLNQQNPIGPNMLLKVMSGDLLNLRVDYFFNETSSSGGSGLTNVANSLLNAFTVSIPAVNAGAKEVATHLQSQLTNASGALASYLANPDNGDDRNSLPHAYLNWIFFDENFNLKEYDPLTGLGSGAYRVEESGDNRSLIKTGIKAPGNGYVFIYLSNTSSTNVWFDNLSITHARGRLMQENHYYPYGLQIASISSKSYGKLDNYFRFQGAFSQFEEETGWDNFMLRNYDSQLGRWTSIDPFDEFPTGYIGMGGDPINLTDPTGGFSFPSGPAPVPSFKFEPLEGMSPLMQGLSSSIPVGFYDWIRSKSTGKMYYSAVSSQKQTDRAFGEGKYRYLGKEYNDGIWSGSPAFYNEDGSAFKWSPIFGPITLKVETLPVPPRNSFIVFGDKFETQQTRDMIRQNVLDEDIAQVHSDRLGDAGVEVLLGFAPVGRAFSFFNRLRAFKMAQRGIVNLTEELFSRALVGAENVAGYSIYGTKGLVGGTFNRNIFLVEAAGLKSLAGFRSLVASFEAEALSAGASKISIYGSSVVNKGFFNPRIAQRFGYSFEKSGSGVFLQKILK